ncbi:MAG: nitronate monooxygenase family protein [Gammaproteobacteria bacterium]|nr:MAG: nitronate monooxygenase family protein [Gammaproteobacteria bacterium]
MIKTSLPLLQLGRHKVLPVFQGGMGIGISAHRLSGAVAMEGAVGTIASVDLRVHHADLMQLSRRSKDYELIDECNLEALDREIRLAREIAPDGFIAVNVMKAVGLYPELVVQACKSGANAIVMGAGLPLDLPDLVEGYDDVCLIPILSEERGVRALLKRWKRKQRLPDAIILEHPRYAGGHLGAKKMEEVSNSKYDFSRIIPKIKEIFRDMGIDDIPLIPAGGINSFESLKQLFDIGASGVQVGTPFAVAEEGDAHPVFKKVILDAGHDDIVTFMSTAGLPARAVRTPWLERYLRKEKKLQSKASPDRNKCIGWAECLTYCGFRDGNPSVGQFCILKQLEAAVMGDYQRGLFFRGSEPLIFGKEIRSVRDILKSLLTAT